MRRILYASLALCLVLIWVVPAMAVDLKFKGSYQVQGFMDKDYALTRDPATSTDSYMDMRFRLETTFQVTDWLSVVTRFDALEDKKWGDESQTEDGHTINWHQTYMRIGSTFGWFEIGRRGSNMWGTSFADTETEKDSIWYMLPIGNFGLKAYYEKDSELDEGNIVSDSDTDSYYIAPFYRGENLEAGMLYGFTRSQAPLHYRSNGGIYFFYSDDMHRHKLSPYFIASFGPLSLQGELIYQHGRFDRTRVPGEPLPYHEIKIRQLAANFEGTFTAGPTAFQAGYAFMSGDSDGQRDGKIEDFGGFGEDWEKLYILTTSTGPAFENLGGADHGNLAKGNPSGLGVHLFYAGADYNVRENLTFGALYGFARTHKEVEGVERTIGHEFDLTLNWKIYPNLSYTAIGAWFSPGKYWESLPHIGSDNREDAYAMFHNLTLSF